MLIGLAGIGVAIYQWYTSDTVAMKAMRAREVSPEQAPELHGMIDRLCTLADMPKPRVGIADTSVPNAFATGRSPERSVVCVTTGILGMLTAEELEGVLAHELSHVAHRDVLVMTVASLGRHRRRHAHPGRAVRHVLRGFGGRRNNDNNNGLPVWLVVLVVSLVVYAVSFVLLRILSRYRELSADRAGAYLTLKPAALASALQKITGEINAIPERDLRQVGAASALCIAPAIEGALKTLTSTHPSLEQRLEQLATIQAELGRPRPEAPMGFLDSHPRAQQARSRPTSTRCSACRAPRSRLQAAIGLVPTGDGSVCYRAAAGAGFADAQADVVELLERTPDGPAVRVTHDGFGFTWLEVDHEPYDPASGDLGGLCTDLHAVNTTPGGGRVRAGPAVLAGPVHRRRRPLGWGWSTSTSRARSTPSPRSPAADAAARQPARDPGARRPRRRAARRAGPLPLAGDLGRPGL